jgi:hypothetical protein
MIAPYPHRENSHQQAVAHCKSPTRAVSIKDRSGMFPRFRSVRTVLRQPGAMDARRYPMRDVHRCHRWLSHVARVQYL